jgi:hypothetical protein
MVKFLTFKAVGLIGTLALILAASAPSILFAAEKEKTAKKKATPDAKVAKPKTAKSGFQTAETAAKATACFGETPKIEKVVPDEGKAGQKVTITGTRFGSADCLRSVSFGPGHAAKFTVQNDTTITASVPTGGRKGLALLTVTTASGEDSKPFFLK